MAHVLLLTWQQFIFSISISFTLSELTMKGFYCILRCSCSSMLPQVASLKETRDRGTEGRQSNRNSAVLQSQVPFYDADLALACMHSPASVTT